MKVHLSAAAHRALLHSENSYTMEKRIDQIMVNI